MNIVIKIVSFAALSAVIYLGIALILILSQWPKGRIATETGLDFTRQLAEAAPTPQKLETLRMRDGSDLPIRRYVSGATDLPLVVLVHGSGWHGLQFDALARELQPFADVIVPDLRGHGVSPARRGDVDYIGQFEDDLADIILQSRKPGQQVFLAGHSSGGGLVVRFAGGPHGGLLDRAILMAPFLKYNAPTTRENAGGWAKTLTRRIIGLSMLNTLGIKALNRLTVIEFAFPQAVLSGPLGATATRGYSFRLNTGFAPRPDYLADVAKLPPFLLVAGTKDEAFVAEAYEPLMRGVTDQGQYLLLSGVSHLDVVNAPETKAAMIAFLQKAK